jgi:serine/threonine protein kinase
VEEVVYLVWGLSGLRHVAAPASSRNLKRGTCSWTGGLPDRRFGLAKIPDSDLTDVDELFGSREYIAPELYYRGAREATASSDLFAVGRIFADLVDQVDFSRSRAGVFASKAAALKYLDELLKRLVEEDPKLRFDSAESVLKVSTSSGVDADPTSAPSRGSRRRASSRRPFAAAGSRCSCAGSSTTRSSFSASRCSPSCGGAPRRSARCSRARS